MLTRITAALPVCAQGACRESHCPGVQQFMHTNVVFSLLDGESEMLLPTLLQCCCVLSAFEKVLCNPKLPLRYPPGSLT